MYFSKIMVKPTLASAKVMLKLKAGDSYFSHQLIWTLFADQKKRSFLFREELKPNGLPEFYVLSDTLPVDSQNAFDVQSKKFEPKLAPQQRLAFSLRANPTLTIKADGKARRHDVLMHAKHEGREKGYDDNKIALAMDAAAKDWISHEHRLTQWGFEIIKESIFFDGYRQSKSKKRNGQRVSFSSVDYQGILTITDVERFLHQYKKGFGRAKSMGCGLMLIRRV